MFLNKESIFVTIICAAGLGIFVALWLLDFAVVRIVACEANESRGLCLRGWISALSGWAAAIGALIAAGLTIAKLREQIAEQKRQTDFMLGDAKPTLDSIVDIDNPQQVVLRIVNWNRRAFQIQYVDTHDIGEQIIIASPKMNDEDFRFIHPYPIINGWENRNNAPHNFRFKILITHKTDSDNFAVMSDFPSGTKITVRGILFSATHQPFELTCYLHPQAEIQ